MVEVFSHRIISQKLNRHHSSISQETSHNSYEKYQAEKAEENSQKQKESCDPVNKFSPKISKTIKEK